MVYALGVSDTVVFCKGDIVMHYGGESPDAVESHYPGFTGTYMLGSVQGEIKDLDTDVRSECTYIGWCMLAFYQYTHKS